MAAIAPDTTESAAPRWLGSFLETWEPGTGAPIEDREPATGRHLATIPGSTPDDVARAAAAAKAAQPAWAATSYQERARVLRRAAEIYEANRDEFGTWTQRETGASHSKMHHESNFAYHEILNAATLPSQAYGSLMPSAVQGPAVHGPPRPGRGHRRDHAVELAVRARDARRRAGAGARQRGRAQAGSADAGRVAARCSRRSSAKRACPRACSRSSSAARTSARRWSPTRTYRSCRSRARQPSGGGSASWPAACSRRCRWSSVATTRSSCSTTPTSTRPPRPGRSPRSSSRARCVSPPGVTSSTAAWPTPTRAP